MISIDDRIRDAWVSTDPMALHTLAERLAGEGQPEGVILDGLERLLLEVRANGADDVTEDRIMDVMDRLTGWCHASHHIRTTVAKFPARG
jgi:hypothetical protein